jgi:hypothetical protein
MNEDKRHAAMADAKETKKISCIKKLIFFALGLFEKMF